MTNMFKTKTETVVEEAEPASPATQPDTSSEGVTEANRRAQEKVVSRAGRNSTILTASKDRGASYSGTKLGTSA